MILPRTPKVANNFRYNIGVKRRLLLKQLHIENPCNAYRISLQCLSSSSISRRTCSLIESHVPAKPSLAGGTSFHCSIRPPADFWASGERGLCRDVGFDQR